MRASVLLCLVLLFGTALSSNIHIVNRCGWLVGAYATGNLAGNAPTQWNMNAGASVTYSYGTGASFNIKVEPRGNGITLAEFSINSWSNLDFYDLSVINGYDTPFTLVAPDGTTLVCNSLSCPAAYLYPTDDSKTHSVATGGIIV